MVFHHASGRCATVALVLISCVLIAACDSNGKPVRTAHEAVGLIDSKRLLTCTHLSYRPFEFRQGSRVVGFDVDMIDLIAEELGVRREIVDTPFEGIQSGEALNWRTCDIAAAAMTITPARRQSIAFSTAYFDADQALLVRKRSHVDEFADLEGMKLGSCRVPRAKPTPTSMHDRRACASRTTRASRVSSAASGRARSQRPSTTSPCCSTTPSTTPTCGSARGSRPQSSTASE